jgi:hypothetical protein
MVGMFYMLETADEKLKADPFYKFRKKGDK